MPELLAALLLAAVLALPVRQTVAAAEAVCPGLPPFGEVVAHDGHRAWLAGPRDTYRHGVFGERREPGALVLAGPAAQRSGLDCLVDVLPEDRVFEDRAVRFWDADGDGQWELVVVEAQLRDGARLAVYEVTPVGLQRAAEASPIGHHRWLSPIGVLPLGAPEGGARGPLLAAVTTPHIGGVLRLYRYDPGNPDLSEVARLPGWSTHRFGSSLPSTALVETDPGGVAWIVLPDQDRRRLSRLRWQDGDWQVQPLGGTGSQVTGAIESDPDGCHYLVPTATGTVRLPRPPPGGGTGTAAAAGNGAAPRDCQEGDG